MADTRRVRLPVEEPWQEADLNRPHLVGIGGAGMSALARVLLSAGAQVSGSDRSPSPRLAALAAAGATVHTGHKDTHVSGASCVIASTAIENSNVELAGARRRGIPILHRAQALAQLMRGDSGVVVTGTHGKTTTCAMLTHILAQTGGNPSYAFGGDWTGPATGGHFGEGPIFVAEADESDRSFRWLHPGLAVVTSIDDDHFEQYASPEVFADEVTAWLLDMPDAAIVANADDPRVTAATDIAGRQRITYGRSLGADVRIGGISIEPGTWIGKSDLRLPSGDQVRIRLNVPGRHMISNAAAALTAALHLGVEVSMAVAALETYQPVQRRLTIHGEAAGVRVIDSFAHHPAAIRADLETAETAIGPKGRLLVAFQPSGHRRVQTLGKQIGSALAMMADEVILLPVYDPYDTGTGTALRVWDAVRDQDVKISFAADHEYACASITADLQPGDVVVTMGTGNVTTLGPRLLNDLRRQLPPGAEPPDA